MRAGGRGCRRLEGLGTRIEYRRVDVADGAAVSALITELRETLWRGERDPACGGGDPRQLSVEEDGGGSAARCWRRRLRVS